MSVISAFLKRKMRYTKTCHLLHYSNPAHDPGENRNEIVGVKNHYYWIPARNLINTPCREVPTPFIVPTPEVSKNYKSDHIISQGVSK